MKKSIYSKEHKYTANQLKKARISAKISQVAAAKLLNKTQSYISKIESGQRRIDVTQLNNFAKIYKRQINFFIYRQKK